MTQAIPSLPGQAHEVADRILIAWHLKPSIPFVQILQVVGADRLNLIVSFLACNAQTFVVPQFTFIGVCSLVVHWIDVMSYSYYCSCQSCFFLSCLCAVKETLISIRTIKALAWERLSYEKLYQARLAVE